MPHPKPELAAIHRSLADTTARLRDLAHVLKGEEHGEAHAHELLTIESALTSGERRLERLLRRL